MSRSRTLLLAGAVTVGCASVSGALALASLDRRGAPALELQKGVPIAASAAELRSAGGAGDVYWAGSVPSRQMELTKTERGTFVRYLPADVDLGDRRALYLTVATYPMPRAFAVATDAAKKPGVVKRAAPGGAIAVWQKKRPTSIYLARAGSDRLVEVFDPDPRRARSLILSGRVVPVPSE
jgi:hypothetical protein